jgi:hypothetical protein
MGQPTRAVRLAGAAVALRAGPGQPVNLWSFSEAEVARWLEPARRAVGAQAAIVAWAEGQAMTLEQAVAYALEEPGDA